MVLPPIVDFFAKLAKDAGKQKRPWFTSPRVHYAKNLKMLV
jgi:hypothetical protein